MTGASTALPGVVTPVTGSPARVGRAAWALLAVAALCVAGVAVAQEPWDPAVVAQAVFVLVWTAAAALIVRHRPVSPVALAAGVFLVAFPLMFTGIAATAMPQRPVVAAAVNVLGGTSFLCFAYLFPDGHFEPGWTRWMAAGWTIVLVLDQTAHLAGVTSGGAVAVLRATAWVVSLLSAVGVQIHGYRRVSGERAREQAKWVSYGIAVGVGGFVLTVALDEAGALGTPDQAEAVVTALAYAFVSVIPVCLAVAVIRHRLWDIDLLINRTLVYLLLSAVAFGLYALAVAGVSAAAGEVGALPTSAAAIVVLTVSLHPLHVRLQRLVNRLLYGRRDDPYSVLAELGQRLSAAASADGVLPTIVQTTASALRLPYAAIALTTPDGASSVVTSAGEPGTTTASWPLEHEGERVGLLLASPRRGERFAGSDRRVLSDLAARAGAAVHALGLARDLDGARARLVLAREEERRRLHRDLHDDLGATLSALTLKAGAAHALLETDPAGAATAIEEVEHDLQATVAEVRRLVYALRPPALDDRGLCAAVEDNLVQLRSALSVELAVEPAGPWPPLPAAVELAAYRITQEALANAARHSGGRRCCVRLCLQDGDGGPVLAIEVTDDGTGLPERVRRGVGLDSMQERAAELGGRCSIGNDPDGGLRVSAVLPLQVGRSR